MVATRHFCTVHEKLHGLGVAIHACVLSNCVCSEVYIGNRLGVYVSRITDIICRLGANLMLHCAVYLVRYQTCNNIVSFLLSAFHPSPLSGGPNQWYDWVMGRWAGVNLCVCVCVCVCARMHMPAGASLWVGVRVGVGVGVCQIHLVN